MKLSRPRVMYLLVSLWGLSSLLLLGIFVSDLHTQDKINTLNNQVMIAKELLVVERDSLQRQSDRLSDLLSQIESQTTDLASSQSWFYLGDTLYFQNLLADYIGDIELGNQAAMEIHKLLVGINAISGTDETSARAAQLICEVKAAVFYALFSGHQQNPTIYRTFDRIYLISQQLQGDNKVIVQKTLSFANKLLEKEASLSHSVAYLNSSKLENEYSSLHQGFNERIKFYIAFNGGLTIAILCALLLLSHRVERLLTSTSLPDTDAMILKTDVQVEDSTTEPFANSANAADIHLTTMNETSEEDKAIDIAVLHDSMNGDVEAMKLLLGIFIQEHQNDSNRMRTAIEKNTLSRAQHSAHSLKGVSGSIGARSLRDIAFKLEKQLKSGETPSEKDLQQLDSLLAKAVISANYHLGQLNQ